MVLTYIATLAILPVGQAPALDTAYANKDWPLVSTLANQYLNQNGYDWRAAKKLVEALVHLDRPQDAVSRMRTFYNASNVPSRAVTYTHALAEYGKFAEARAIFGAHAGYVSPTSGSYNDYHKAIYWRVSIKEFELTWQITDGTTGEYWIALPQDSYNQHLLSYTVTGGTVVDLKKDELVNTIIKVAIPGPGPFQMTARVKLIPASVRHLVNAEPTFPTFGPTFPLGITPGINPTTATVNAITEHFQQKIYRQRIESTMLYANNHLTYTPPGSTDGLDHSEDVLIRGGGHCEGLTMGISALLRRVGVPARMIRGQSAISDSSGEMRQHTILQYWLPNLGWIDWDHTLPRFELRSDFVRMLSYQGAIEPQQDPINFWHHREFLPLGQGYLNGPYTYQLLSHSFTY